MQKTISFGDPSILLLFRDCLTNDRKTFAQVIYILKDIISIKLIHFFPNIPNMSISSNERGFKSLVLSGGGVRALAHVGAITRLEQLEMLTEFSNYCGASAGAGIAALLASGYTCEELFKFMITLDYRSFVNHNPMPEILRSRRNPSHRENPSTCPQ